MYKKSLYKNIEFYTHKNFFPCNKWNTIQVFSISAQLYQKCPKNVPQLFEQNICYYVR